VLMQEGHVIAYASR
jgi:ribonuclease HI